MKKSVYVTNSKENLTRHESFFCGKHLDKNKVIHRCGTCQIVNCYRLFLAQNFLLML